MRLIRGSVRELPLSRRTSTRRIRRSSFSSSWSIFRLRAPRRRLSAVWSSVHSMRLLMQFPHGTTPVHCEALVSDYDSGNAYITEQQGRARDQVGTLSLRALHARHAVPTFFLR